MGMRYVADTRNVRHTHTHTPTMNYEDNLKSIKIINHVRRQKRHCVHCAHVRSSIETCIRIHVYSRMRNECFLRICDDGRPTSDFDVTLPLSRHSHTAHARIPCRTVSLMAQMYDAMRM